MPHSFAPRRTNKRVPLQHLYRAVDQLIDTIPPLVARGNRPLQMEFAHQLKALVAFHIEEHTSGRDLLQFLEEDDYARTAIAPPKGIKRSSFFEAINTRGLEQMFYVFNQLQAQASKLIPNRDERLGQLIAIDGSYIEAVFSMYWADYSVNNKKAKAHVAFDLGRSLPFRIALTSGKVDERPYVDELLHSGQTGVMDRNYQSYKLFDSLQAQGKHFVCRIRIDSQRTILSSNTLMPGSIVFYDSIVLLGTRGVNQTEKKVRVVGYRVDNKEYWIATDRFDLTAEEIAAVYKSRWAIEKFFGWWKRHLKVYHIIARSRYGLTVQLLSGLISYLLLAIYCHDEYGETVSIKRVRQLRNDIRNSLRDYVVPSDARKTIRKRRSWYANT